MSEPALILSTLSASRPKQACNMRDHPAQTLQTLSQIFLHSHLLWWRSRTVLTITQTNRKYLRRARALSQHLHTFVHLVLVQLESSNAASQGCSTPSTEAANQTECQWHSRWITAATRWQFIYIFNFFSNDGTIQYEAEDETGISLTAILANLLRQLCVDIRN